LDLDDEILCFGILVLETGLIGERGWLCNLFILFIITWWLWEQFLKNGFLLVVIAVVYLQPWLKNKLVDVQYAKALIEIR
jgi:hypothetical protein